MTHDPIARVRRFNRAVTREVGALDTSYLGRGRPLGAARVVWLVRPDGTDVTDIRRELAIDSGLLSRLLRSLETEGLLTTTADPADRRRRIVRLTAKGEAERDAYIHLNDAMAQRMLTIAPRLSGQVLAAMDLIATVLNRDHVDIRLADPDEPAAQFCLSAYFDLLVAKVDGITPGHVPLPDPYADSYRPPQGAFLLAWSDGVPLGCVSLHVLSPGLGEVKRLWVAPEARGQGLARRLMRAIEDRARAMGLTRLNLDTNAALTDAIALYQADGWIAADPYTGPPATHWFTKAL